MANIVQTQSHYSIVKIGVDEAMDVLRKLFPTAEADELNFVLFSTSGVHGSYTTIEDIEVSLKKYCDVMGEQPAFKDGEAPEDFDDTLTFVVVHPRLVCMRYGNVRPKLQEIDWLKKLRASSQRAASLVGNG